MDSVKDAARPPTPVRAWWGVVVLMALYAFSLLDRQVISLLVDDIRRDLKVTDVEVGLLQGLSFAVFYAIFGLAFGRATDKASRRWVVFIGVGLWSIAAAACGLARNFWQLLVARFGVGAGEGSLSPAAYSLISDSFPPERLAVPLSVFGIGSTIGVALSYGVTGAVMGALPRGGVTAPLFGHLALWQLTFLITAAPGALLCWLAFTIADPGRRARRQGAPPERLFGFVRQRRRFLFGHFFGYALLSLCAYGVMGWEPMLLHRVYGWAMPKAALALMVQNLIIALGGPFVLGPLIDAWFKRGQKDAHLRLFMMFALVELVFVLLAVTASNPFLCIGFFILWGWMSNTTGPAAAALQIVTPGEIRGQVSSLFILVFTLTGAGLGATVVGAFTTLLFKDDLKVGWSIALTFLIVNPIAAACLAFAMKPMREAVAEVEAQRALAG